MKKTYSLFLALFLSASAFAAGHTVTLTQTNITCFGDCNGSITAIVSGGIGPFSYDWTPGVPIGDGTPTITSLCSGTWSVTVTDNSDMSTATATATITQPPLLTLGIGGSTICAGSCTTLLPLASGGTPAYTFIWSGGLFGPAPTACPASSTTYTVTVTDANGCVATATSLVTTNPSPTITVLSSYTACMGGCVGLAATATGGSAFVWTPATSLSSTTIVNPVSCPTATTTYTVVATLAGCTATAVTTVFVGGAITSNITSTNTTGCTTCDGAATTTPTGGTSPYAYNWSTGSISPAVNFICPGTYSVTITDVNGCTLTDSTTIFSNNDVAVNFTMVPDSTNPYNFFCFNSSAGTGNTYQWEFGDGVTSNLASPSHTYAPTGTYNVCLVASSFLCGADTLCQLVNVTGVPASCLALFNIADDTLNPDPNAHYIYNLSYGATLSYLWDFGDGTTSTSMTPSHVYAGTGPYLLCLSVDNGAGCTDMFCDSLISADSLNRSSGTMQLVVYDVPTFYTATGISDQANLNSIALSPNPFNDVTVFEIKSNKTEVYSFELTDVLGKKVKSKTGITEKQFEISREGLQNGIYFYKVYTSESIVGIGKVVIK